MSETMSIVERVRPRFIRELRACRFWPGDGTRTGSVSRGPRTSLRDRRDAAIEGNTADHFGFMLEGTIRVYRTVGE